MSTLSHPNVIMVEEMFLDISHGFIYYVMEYCRGSTLTAALESEKKLKASVVKRIFVELVEGVRYLHARGVIHRDINPNNIMLLRKGNHLEDACAGPMIKIIDFNVSKFFNEDEIPPHSAKKFRYEDMLTETGTVSYRAPEIAKNEKYSEAVDLWALGCVLFKLVEGREPFQSE